jgi:hypothetical protein
MTPQQELKSIWTFDQAAKAILTGLSFPWR